MTNPIRREAGTPTSTVAPEQTGSNSLGEEATAALQTALAAEHAALWAYGLVAAFDPAVADIVTTMVTGHQSTRDAAANLIVSGGATPVGPEPAYTSPVTGSDEAAAIEMALTIETDCANAWRAVIGSTDDSALRGTALTALTDSALRMVTWRKAADQTPLTEPFPGDPQAG